MDEKEHPCSGLYPYTAAPYTTIGIGERHTGQACVLRSLTATMIYTCYDKIYTVLGTGRAPPGQPGPRAPPAWYQALPEQAQKACLLGALLENWSGR